MRSGRVIPSGQNSFSFSILAGKGVVIENARPPYNDAKGATHFLVEPKKFPNQKMDFEALAKQCVAVVRPVYMNEFLVNDPPPNVDDFIIEEYKKVWEEFCQNGSTKVK